MTVRQLIGIVHLVFVVLLAFTFVFQIVDLAIGGGLVPNEYFVYFTVDTTMIAVVPLAMVTGVVYNVTLRGRPTEAHLGMPWENEVLHVAMPLFLTIDWFVLRLLDRGRPALPWSALGIALVFPVLWLVVTFTRGLLTGW